MCNYTTQGFFVRLETATFARKIGQKLEIESYREVHQKYDQRRTKAFRQENKPHLSSDIGSLHFYTKKIELIFEKKRQSLVYLMLGNSNLK